MCITEVYGKSALAPMNKFVYKLHWYFVHLQLFPMWLSESQGCHEISKTKVHAFP